jgi:hypothetical protein
MRAKALRELLSERQGWRCYWCGGLTDRPCGPGESNGMTATLEHLTPLRDGGATDEENCVMACRACNSNRDKEPHLYASAIETRQGRDAKLGSVHESAVATPDAQC